MIFIVEKKKTNKDYLRPQEDPTEPHVEEDKNTVTINQKNKNLIKIDRSCFTCYTREELIRVANIFGLSYPLSELKTTIAEDLRLYLQHDLWNFFTLTLDLEKVKKLINHGSMKPRFKKKFDGWQDLNLYKQIMVFTTFIFMNHLLKIDNKVWFEKHVFRTCDADFDFLVVELKD